MNLRTLIQTASLCLALALSLGVQAKDSGDCDVPIGLGKKPEMSDHSQLNAFIAAALEYKAQKKKQDQHRKACPELYKRPPVVWIDDPTVTQGPETLESAVERSDTFPSLDYGATNKWYGRTTSQSFGLSDASPDQLADSLIRTSLFIGNGTPQGDTDAGLTRDQENALLLSSSLNFTTDDGAFASELVADQLFESLFFVEQDTQNIFATAADEFVNIDVVPSFFGGFATISNTTRDYELLTSRYEMTTCLSSCDDLVITIQTAP